MNDIRYQMSEMNQEINKFNKLEEGMKEFEKELSRLKEIDVELKKITDINTELDQKLQAIDENVAKQAKDLLNEMQNLKDKIQNLPTTDFNKLIDDKLEIFANDRIGIMDYALSSLGSKIIAHSETFTPFSWNEGFSALLSVFHTEIQTPNIILETSTTPGHCWPFKGSNGFVLIKLFTPIIPEAFSIDHISSVSRPKDFRVRGYESIQDNGDLLGEFTFGLEKSLQTFEVKKEIKKKYQFYKLNITSNHGNSLFTCLYRFRVHGKQ